MPQPPSPACATCSSARAALDAVGLPAVLKPADSGGQRGVFCVESQDDLDAHLHAALAESPTGEAILESFHDGLELNGLVIARDGEASRSRSPTACGRRGRLRRRLDPRLPARRSTATRSPRRSASPSHAVHALGLRDGIAFPQLIVGDDGRCAWSRCAARIPGGQMADLARHAVGVDLVEVAMRQALGDAVPDELVRPRFRQPLAIRFLTAQPGPAADRHGASRSARSSRCWRRRASCRPTSTSRSARRSGPCGSTATAAAT